MYLLVLAKGEISAWPWRLHFGQRGIDGFAELLGTESKRGRPQWTQSLMFVWVLLGPVRTGQQVGFRNPFLVFAGSETVWPLIPPLVRVPSRACGNHHQSGKCVSADSVHCNAAMLSSAEMNSIQFESADIKRIYCIGYWENRTIKAPLRKEPNCMMIYEPIAQYFLTCCCYVAYL